MARHGAFFRVAGGVNAKTKTPIVATIIQGAWASVLCSVGTFQQLITYAVFTVSIFFVLAAFAVMRLRRTQPDTHRPFRTPLYPWLPILTALANGGLVINTVAADPKGSAIGIAMVLLGLPVYYLFRATSGKRVAAEVAG